MLIDTDVVIWVERGNVAAAERINEARPRCISIRTYMELLQCAPDKAHQRRTRDFLKAFDFEMLPLTDNIGHRAAVYIEEYSLAHGLRAGDAIIAATASEHGLALLSANAKHFTAIAGLNFVRFQP